MLLLIIRACEALGRTALRLGRVGYNALPAHRTRQRVLAVLIFLAGVLHHCAATGPKIGAIAESRAGFDTWMLLAIGIFLIFHERLPQKVIGACKLLWRWGRLKKLMLARRIRRWRRRLLQGLTQWGQRRKTALTRWFQRRREGLIDRAVSALVGVSGRAALWAAQLRAAR